MEEDERVPRWGGFTSTGTYSCCDSSMSMTSKGFAKKTSWELGRICLWAAPKCEADVNYLMFQEKGDVFGRILNPNVTDDTSFKNVRLYKTKKSLNALLLASATALYRTKMHRKILRTCMFQNQ